MKKISSETIKTAATLSGLLPSDEMLGEINESFSFVKIEEDFLKTAKMPSNTAPLREDAVEKPLSAGEILQAAPKSENGFFCLPGGKS